jgi:hypothetical protein
VSAPGLFSVVIALLITNRDCGLHLRGPRPREMSHFNHRVTTAFRLPPCGSELPLGGRSGGRPLSSPFDDAFVRRASSVQESRR